MDGVVVLNKTERVYMINTFKNNKPILENYYDIGTTLYIKGLLHFNVTNHTHIGVFYIVI